MLVAQPKMIQRTIARTRHKSHRRTSQNQTDRLPRCTRLMPRGVVDGGGEGANPGGDRASPYRLRYRDGTLIVKWDLDNQKAMKGAATRRILELIRELEAEGLL